jgi:hypothetical protein
MDELEAPSTGSAAPAELEQDPSTDMAATFGKPRSPQQK